MHVWEEEEGGGDGRIGGEFKKALGFFAVGQFAVKKIESDLTKPN